MIRRQTQISVEIENGDARSIEADVLALKYAQAFYGADAAVARRLFDEESDTASLLPELSGFRLLPTNNKVAAKSVLFIGVSKLYEFGYQEIRDFSRKVLDSLAIAAPKTQHVCLTLHGPGYGLDEMEAFESEIAGLLDAIKSGNYPDHLQKITIVERSVSRANRLLHKLNSLIPDGLIEIGQDGQVKQLGSKTQERLENAGYASETKNHVFVAMPFAEEMDDVFHYGIQGAVNAAGLLCERADLSSFTGDVMEWVKKRIASAHLVIADLSAANPNVYLEVGYAWGCGRPTVLICRDESELKFDVKGQRCLIYKKIKELEATLKTELENLKGN